MYAPQVKERLDAAFPNGFNADQLWAIVNYAKLVRLRCRSNAAFNNAANTIFTKSGATFRQVTKQHADGTPYPGLSITVNGNTSEAPEEE